MRIAVLSGKGGTGKTLVSVNLARLAGNSHYIDCDIEEPNGHLFFKPALTQKEEIKVKMPVVDHTKCNGCRKCIDKCRFNAMAYIYNKVLIFEEVCHSCGACSLLCPEKAISESDKVIGEIQHGTSDMVKVSSGFLNIGESSGIPVIRQLLKQKTGTNDVIIDCPPGSACSVMESIQDADFCLLVAEPSIFGAHNLNMVYELVKLFNKKHAVVLNKTMEGENPSEEFCQTHLIPILSRIPYSQEIAKQNSDAEIIIDTNPQYRELFAQLLENIKKELAI
ncbi:MAG TPA: ATP-binding protein [Candidatus Cloacimonadota bacterium]|nr:ATP-binding protein [Candidatus Cloacimonadota bacterium]HPM00599.1 ATP-binding protein [Candidatus Cloacimonadota bacterium]